MHWIDPLSFLEKGAAILNDNYSLNLCIMDLWVQTEMISLARIERESEWVSKPVRNNVRGPVARAVDYGPRILNSSPTFDTAHHVTVGQSLYLIVPHLPPSRNRNNTYMESEWAWNRQNTKWSQRENYIHTLTALTRWLKHSREVSSYLHLILVGNLEYNALCLSDKLKVYHKGKYRFL